MKSAAIALEDGTIFYGRAFGADGLRYGELVFNTSMTGYQEILTDPSYRGQIVALTYPEIGNVGTNNDDNESYKPHVEGFVIKELSPIPSNFRSLEALNAYLKRNNIIGVQNVDTRALTRHIRQAGAMRAVISTVDMTPEILIARAKESPGLVGRDLVREVTTDEAYEFTKEPVQFSWSPRKETFDAGLLVVAYDFGIKENILLSLTGMGARVRVVPASTPAEEVMAMRPDGIFLSNGPGDPMGVDYAITEVGKLLTTRTKGKPIFAPIFGICLGHQILALALGGETYKLKFGHRGGNQPVKNLETGRIEITAQNHGFAVRRESLPPELEVTHVNLNDQTVEGVRHKKLPVFGVQYHPEASPGPHDSNYLFSKFITLMRDYSRNAKTY